MKPIPIRANKKVIKIKYISNPVTIQVQDASEFRAVVQNLTGKHSGANGACTNDKEGKVEVPRHECDPTIPHPHSDIALHDDTIWSWFFEQQTYSQADTLESFVSFLSQQ
ncbi:hypothetical protein VNO77_18520 [Canavalia gladiata]|uniref:VQ domain-containing protein n=1 Tax=Canavalia gladiata TaxID=3824 RepID=A0AAN9LQZ6_CANGL